MNLRPGRIRQHSGADERVSRCVGRTRVGCQRHLGRAPGDMPLLGTSLMGPAKLGPLGVTRLHRSRRIQTGHLAAHLWHRKGNQACC